jgi:4-hydroxy-4-methyl-2-oxoglutarate aldolase
MTQLRPEKSLVEQPLRDLRAAVIYEANGKLGDMSPAIFSIVPGTRLFGRAYTVKGWPGDGSAFFRAVAEAPAGSVLVIDAGGDELLCSWGGSSTLAARNRGIAGVVTNGSVRDVQTIREIGFPVFAAGICVRGGVRHHPGWTGIPIAVGGVPVHPDDLVVGDDDGVVVVAAERIATIIPAALKRHAFEAEADARLRAGEDFATVSQPKNGG